MFSTAGAGAVQLNDGCGLLVTADGIDGIEPKDGSGFGVVTAVVGGCVVFASVIRGGDTRPGLDVVRGLSKRKPVPVFGSRNEGRGFAKSSGSSSRAGRGEGGGFNDVGSLAAFSGSP